MPRSLMAAPGRLLEIEGPHERPLLEIASRGRLRSQGLTQLSFESAEPSFDELAPDDFLRRFPEGRYEIEGRAQNGVTFEAMAMLSHVLAAPSADRCLGRTGGRRSPRRSFRVVSTPVFIDWDPVTTSHLEVGTSGARSDQPLPALCRA